MRITERKQLKINEMYFRVQIHNIIAIQPFTVLKLWENDSLIDIKMHGIGITTVTRSIYWNDDITPVFTTHEEASQYVKAFHEERNDKIRNLQNLIADREKLIIQQREEANKLADKQLKVSSEFNKAQDDWQITKSKLHSLRDQLSKLQKEKEDIEVIKENPCKKVVVTEAILKSKRVKLADINRLISVSEATLQNQVEDISIAQCNLTNARRERAKLIEEIDQLKKEETEQVCLIANSAITVREQGDKITIEHYKDGKLMYVNVYKSTGCMIPKEK